MGLDWPFFHIRVRDSVNRPTFLIQLPSFTVEEAESDVLNGRGGCCMAIAPFVVELLQGLGFRSHVMEGFHTGHKQYYHYAAIVRDVVTPGDVHYIDVGTFPPFTRCMDITNVIEKKTNGIDAATLPNEQRGILERIWVRLCLIANKNSRQSV